MANIAFINTNRGKKILLRIIFILAISFGLQLVFHEIRYRFFYKEKPAIPIESEKEYFDPALMRLNSVSRFTEYCDSVYGSKEIKPQDSSYYATIVEVVLRGRFYHGYTYYKLGQNFIAYALAPFIHRDLSAIVIPDDILKRPNAACSQQSIIGMEVFKAKGISVRKVGFYDKKFGGHFCFEAWYGGKWHYFDPDMEPRISVLVEKNHPGFEELKNEEGLLVKLYPFKEEGYVNGLFRKYTYGEINEFPAKKAKVYQYISKFLSYTLWLWLYLLYVILKRKFNK